MDSSMTAADVGAVLNGRGYDGNNMGGMGWIFGLIVLLAILGGGNGFFGNRGGNVDVVTNADLCNANSFNELKSQVGRMGDQQTQIAMQEQRDLCTGLSALEQSINENRFAQQQCCCETKGLIQAEFGQLRQEMAAAREQALRDRVAQLEMDQRFCGVPRLPLSFTYGVNPQGLFSGSGNCCSTLF